MYYLTIYSYVSINVINTKALLYNTLDGSYFILDLNKDLKYVLSIITSENACVEISSNLYKTKAFKSFLMKIENKNMGFIEDMLLFKEKPFSPPLFDLSNNRNEMLPFNRPKHLLDNLREITIYINNTSSTNYSNRKAVKEAHKQLNYIKINNDDKKELDIINILRFIEVLPELIIINILGGNILQFHHFYELLDNLLKYKHKIVFHIHYQDLSSIEDKHIVELISNFNLNILVDFPASIEELNDGISRFKNTDYKLVFLIENDIDFEKSDNIINNMNILSYTQIPFFNGRNLTFFKRNVFINKSDIFLEKQSSVELLIKRISNPLFFGKLILNCDGKLYSSFLWKSLDTFDSFIENKEIIVNGLIEDKSNIWIHNKFQAEPCKKCIYNFLCTPLSNYEKIIGKNNLCSII